MAASVRRQKFGSRSPVLGTCHIPVLVWWQMSGRGLKGIGDCGLWEATTNQEVVLGRGVVLFPAPSPEVNVKDWRNKAGIYWEGADLLGTGGQGSINLLLPL